MLTGLRAQPLRRFAQVGFFVLFVLAPPLNLFRLDVDAGHFVLFGQAWVLDAEAAREPYVLALPTVTLGPAIGDVHQHACLRALALHGLPA